jgi:hypothetical protein
MAMVILFAILNSNAGPPIGSSPTLDFTNDATNARHNISPFATTANGEQFVLAH